MIRDSTKETIERLVSSLADEDGTDDFTVALEMVRSAGLDVAFELAATALVGGARAKRRQDALAVERAASRDLSAQMGESVGPAATTPKAAGVRYGSRAYWDWVESTPEGQSWHADREQWEQERATAFASLITKMTHDLHIIWDREILESSFSLGDGTRVTWAEATVDQHEERAAMFENNAMANAEGAARHRRAVLDLRAHDAATLGAMLEVAA